MRLGRRMAGAGAAACMLFAAYWSLRFARADQLAHSSAVSGAAGAVRLAPANARYWLRWAALKTENHENAAEILDRALATNPHDASAWIRAGLDAEMRGDNGRAERCLLRAARVNRAYEPRWTLANFYFRRGDQRRFWTWVRSALGWSYGDRRPLFDLCWGTSSDGDTILAKAIPDRHEVLIDYLWFLLSENRLDEGAKVAERLERNAAQTDRDALLYFTDRMLSSGRWAQGLSAWNALCARGILPYAPLDPARGISLANGNFAAEPVAGGFDWRFPQVDGVSLVRVSAPGALRISFSGKQPESCEVLARFIPVMPSTAYTLRFRQQTPDLTKDTGLRWRIFDASSGRDLAAEAPQLGAERWSDGAAAFTTAEQTHLVRLALVYQRVSGSTRIEGALWLRDVSIASALNHQSCSPAFAAAAS